LWWTKWRRGRFSPSTSVSPAIHSTNFSILTITRGRYNRPVSGRRPSGPSLDPTPHYAKEWEWAAWSMTAAAPQWENTWIILLCPTLGFGRIKAVPYLRRLVVGFPLRRSGFELRSGHVGFVVDKVSLDRFCPRASVSPANSHSTDCSTLIIYHPGLV
jgi:hypothetical protein